MFAAPRCAANAPMLTILPPPPFSIAGTAARAALSRLRALRPMRKSQSESFVSCTGEPMRKPPAMLHRTSMRPKRSSAFPTAEATLSGLRRSTSKNTWLEWSCRSPLLKSRRASRAPRSANSRATARPRLPEAPVIRTVRSVNCIALPRMVGAAAALENAILRRQDLAGLELRLAAHRGVDRCEIDVRELEQLVDAPDHEIGLLEVVDAVACAHHAGELEADAVGRTIVERENALGVGGGNARAVDAHAVAALDQAELDRVPVDARKIGQHAELLRAQAALAVGLDIVGHHRVHQHRHVAEHIVEHVGLFDVVELAGLADELARGEAAVGEMLEEHLVRNQARHGDDLPAGALAEDVGQAPEVGDRIGADRQPLHAVDKLVAGAARQQPGLALEERAPDRVLGARVLVPCLIDRPVRAFRAHAGRRAVLHPSSLAYAASMKRARSKSFCVTPPASCVLSVTRTLL